VETALKQLFFNMCEMSLLVCLFVSLHSLTSFDECIEEHFDGLRCSVTGKFDIFIHYFKLNPNPFSFLNSDDGSKLKSSAANMSLQYYILLKGKYDALHLPILSQKFRCVSASR